ncbi:MAG: inorganic phosphate transporter [Candidatus Nanopelagicales bacterium]
MDLTAVLVAVVVLALGFDLTNGFHDSSNSLAAPVATRAMTPRQALVVTATFTLLGPIVAGTAVADTVGGLITVGSKDILAILLAALIASTTWNLLTWRFALPSSSSHALVGGLVGAALVLGGSSSVNWGRFDGWRPAGVAGVLVALAISPLLGAIAGWLAEAAGRRALRRADRAITGPLERGQWVTCASLAFAHGSNDAQKTMGLITLALLSAGSLTSFVVPLWVKVACAAAMTLGTTLGGWRIVRTLGRGIYRIRPLDGLASQGSATFVIGTAAALGAPVSTTHVVASAVVGVGGARRRRHVRWPVVREMMLAWVVTLPGCAAIAALIATLEGVLR